MYLIPLSLDEFPLSAFTSCECIHGHIAQSEGGNMSISSLDFEAGNVRSDTDGKISRNTSTAVCRGARRIHVPWIFYLTICCTVCLQSRVTSARLVFAISFLDEAKANITRATVLPTLMPDSAVIHLGVSR